MLKQSLLPDSVSLSNLPQWSRINNFDRVGYPKPFLKDRLRPLPNPSSKETNASNVQVRSDVSLSSYSDSKEDSKEMQMKKIEYLEKTIAFLKAQHSEVLTNLHEEVDRLKRHNQELQFQVAMAENVTVLNSSRKHSGRRKHNTVLNPITPDKETMAPVNIPVEKRLPAPETTILSKSKGNSIEILGNSNDRFGDSKVTFMEEKIKESKDGMKEARLPNSFPAAESEKEFLKNRIPVADVAAGDGPTLSQKNLVPHPPANPPSQRRHMDVQISKSNNHAPAIISIEPFQVSSSTDSPRQPTLQECQKIIKKLSIENDRQSLELRKIKQDLREVLYTHKWTPDSYLLAKSYIGADGIEDEPAFKSGHAVKKLPSLVSMSRVNLLLPGSVETSGPQTVEKKHPVKLPHRPRHLQSEMVDGGFQSSGGNNS